MIFGPGTSYRRGLTCMVITYYMRGIPSNIELFSCNDDTMTFMLNEWN